MGFVDRAKSAAESAATKTREGVEDMKTKRELGETFDSLGKLTFELAESGEVSHEKITPLVEKIKELKAALES
jgi:cob(I)alamin adenosyltransferase